MSDLEFNGRSIVSIRDFSRPEVEHVVRTALDVKAGEHHEAMAGKVLASLFFEPSTRTRLSFESAMVGMGAANGKLAPMANRWNWPSRREP